MTATTSHQRKCVRVTSGARLHLGPLVRHPEARRQFGGVGLIIDEPRIHLRVEHSPNGAEDVIHADTESASRIRSVIARMREETAQRLTIPPLRITLEETIPPHVGLGSGTQLAVSVVQGTLALVADARFHRLPADLARWAGRGRRSAIGLHGFLHGGFLVDAGKVGGGDDAVPGCLVARAGIPDRWRVTLATPRDARGLSGPAEEKALESLPPTTWDTTRELCRLIVLELLPALHESDFASFSQAVYAYGRLVGESYRAVQGGVYGHDASRRIAEWFCKQGVIGVGQSSWGPTIFAFCEDETAARTLTDQFAGWRNRPVCDIRIAGPRNRAAAVVVE